MTSNKSERCIRSYDLEAISKSERAFLKAFNHDPNCHNLYGFFSILPNIQQKLDEKRHQQH